MVCNQWNIAIVPFPFVDAPKQKKRPVLIISKNEFLEQNAHCIAAMITTGANTKWVGDTLIEDLEKAGLKTPSYIRLKLFSLDMKLEPRVIGKLSQNDKDHFKKNFSKSVF